MTTARLFWNGRSQAVRLPKMFRFEGEEVSIRKEGNSVILEPIHIQTWPEGFWGLFEEDIEFDVPEPLASSPIDLDLP